MTTERQTEGVVEKPPRILLQLSWSGTRVYVVRNRRIPSQSMVHTVTTTFQPSVITQLKHFVYTAGVRQFFAAPSPTRTNACDLQRVSLFASIRE